MKTPGFKLHAVFFTDSIPAVSQNEPTQQVSIVRFVVMSLLVVLALALPTSQRMTVVSTPIGEVPLSNYALSRGVRFD
ncbi:hypothetical protein IMCC3135_13675 [Granulosicoccus antarcticus IMCC3135]|uniref:Uncharacterized protein n=1 Tax=Granulosicoccus antarcticus IMCC3135 TaxID=1192854 RepID=A0A2Z2NVK9_9GAMM|nr:hypothetical protein IMCC3135_13675 [Granulosicoccus antarcticus IMCC3135]